MKTRNVLVIFGILAAAPSFATVYYVSPSGSDSRDGRSVSTAWQSVRKAADEVKFTTCYMCACRCGIKVHLKDGRIRYIEGNRNHPDNRGVLCAKGSAGIMQQYSPAKLRKPLLRVGDEVGRIAWLDPQGRVVSLRLSGLRQALRDPSRLAIEPSASARALLEAGP